MSRVENITQVKAVNSSITTGEHWSSGASMAVDVSENENSYLGGTMCMPLLEFNEESVLSCVQCW